MSFFTELRRRNVLRVGAAYVVVAWLLLQVSDTLVPALHLPEWFHSGVAFLLFLGLPVALLFAWAYELTPDGVRKEKDVNRSQSITRTTGRKLDFTIIGLLVVALGYFVVDKYMADPGPDTSGEVATSSPELKSIAVLPFVPMSAGEDDGYFADGLTEEILNVLAQLPELQVTARTSSFFFKGQNIPVPEIAERLKVVYVVEGSIRRDDDRVRITAQLVRAADGFHLWSQNYDRTVDDVFAVQEDIAENIAAALNVVLDENARRAMRSAGIGNVEAFIPYQKALEAYATAHAQVDNISEYLAKANAYFDQALEVAPELVMIRVYKAELAAHTIIEIAAGFREEKYPGEARANIAMMLEESDRAWALSPPGNQRDILDLERVFFSDDWTALPARIPKAMRAGECPHTLWTRDFVVPFGWAGQLAEKARETLACDPMDFGASHGLPLDLLYAGQPEAALNAVDEAESRGIGHPWLEDVRFFALLAAGHLDDPALRGPKPEGSFVLFDRRILFEAFAGDPELARRMAGEHWSGPNASDWSALIVAAIVGDRERANDFAARIDARPGSSATMAVIVSNCFCGAPFDLETTPNYAARIEEAGFSWPPQKVIDYPTKTW